MAIKIGNVFKDEQNNLKLVVMKSNEWCYHIEIKKIKCSRTDNKHMTTLYSGISQDYAVLIPYNPNKFLQIDYHANTSYYDRTNIHNDFMLMGRLDKNTMNNILDIMLTEVWESEEGIDEYPNHSQTIELLNESLKEINNFRNTN